MWKWASLINVSPSLGCQRVLVADDEGPSAEVGATRHRFSHGSMCKSKYGSCQASYRCECCPNLLFLLQTESGAAKKNFIDQYFGVEYETTYPCSLNV